MSRAAAFKQADLTRAANGAKKAGVQVARYEIDPKSGKIVIVVAQGAVAAEANEWDEVLR